MHPTPLTSAWIGYLSIGLFIAAYLLVIFEEKLHLKKSKPVVLIGTLMWASIGLYEAMGGGGGHAAEEAVKHLVEEIAELFFFILVAMTYINALEERLVWASLRSWLVKKGFSFRQLFWISGVIEFFLSSVADNLTAALIMSTVISIVGRGNRRFIVLGFINVVIAANAGGAWSPFGDITTLMVWTAGKVDTALFLTLLPSSLINWLIPAALMFLFVPKGNPAGGEEETKMKRGARLIIVLGFLTIATAVSFHQFLHLPPFMGMMMGLGYLMFTGFFLMKGDRMRMVAPEEEFNIFRKIQRAEFDTLFFFFGILAAVGALQYVGYLALLNVQLYEGLGPAWANIIVGLVSAVVDNIPLMYAVLQMDPVMGVDQWLLVTLAAGTGGSLLSIGSAAGVACMGVSRENYTFSAHLRWTPFVAAGYIGAVVSQILLSRLFF